MSAFDQVPRMLATVVRPGDLFADLFMEDTTIVVCTSSSGEQSSLHTRLHQGSSIRRVGQSHTQHVSKPGLGEAGLHALLRALQEGNAPDPVPPDGTQLCTDPLPIDEVAGLAHEVARATQQAGHPHVGARVTIILGLGGPATLLHEACGHALEADLAQNSQSAYHGCIGMRVAPPCVTLIDDPQAPAHAPFYAFDDEGEAAGPTVLIEGGILRNYLYDARSAMIDGRVSTGHGRRLNYSYPPLPRMSTTYVAPGELWPKKIISDTQHGIFVYSISGGDTDMGSGRFNLQVGEGYLIEAGRITAPIRGAVLSGLGPDVLRSIDRVGNDCTLMSYCYVCNKLDQFPLLVSIGQPTLRVPRLRVWGG